MQIKSFDVEIPDNDPFKYDLLDREKYAKNLTQIVKKFNDGLVMSIDGQWGSGKTTFIDMWSKYLLKEKITTLHFNAWESDYQSEVLPALISKLSSIVKIKSKFKTNLLKTAGRVLVGFGSAVIDNKLGDGFTKDLTKIGLEEGEKIMNQAIENFENKQKTFEEFKNALSEYATSVEHMPIVFFIDELDRCKPSYAVEVLELVKHLFSVPGIVFVIATDKQQLANSIRGYYGSDLLDGKSYLERIFDIEFTLPEPTLDQFSESLYKHYGLEEFYSDPIRIEPKDEITDLIDVTSHLFYFFNYSLRTQHRIYAKIRVVMATFGNNYKTYPHILITLIILQKNHSDLFYSIKGHKISPNVLHQRLEEVLPDVKDPKRAQVFNYLLAFFIHSYTLSYKRVNPDFKYAIREETIREEVIKTKYDIEESRVVYTYQQIYQDNFLNRARSVIGGIREVDDYIERIEFAKSLKFD
jgi:hypothetical protein